MRKTVLLRCMVAPFAGAWIEIALIFRTMCGILVAPFAGAWIEISNPGDMAKAGNVAPFAGAWIEIHGLTAAE